MMRRLLLYFVALLCTTDLFATGTLLQSEYRWRNDDGDEVTATWVGAPNTSTIITANGVKRLRLQLANTGSAAVTITPKLEYSSNNGATWSTMNNNAAADSFLYVTSTFVADGTPTTAQSTVPAAGTFVAGKVVSVPGATQSLAATSRTEYEWIIGPNPARPPLTTTYIFRTPGLTTQPAAGTYPAINYVVSATGCFGSGNLTAANITTTSVDLGWTEFGPATQWQIEYGLGTTFTLGTGTRVIVGTNPYTLTLPGSGPGAQYSFFVRSICGPNDTSSWTLVRRAFTLLPTCPTPTAPTSNNITTTGADLGWTENGSAGNWQIEYATGTTFTVGSGTRIMAGSNPFTLTVPATATGTQYSYFVRSVCGPNDTSAWSVRNSFATIATCDTPSTPTASNVTTNSADLAWVENGSAIQWQVEYGVGSFTLGTGTRVTANANAPFTLSTLIPGQAYTYFVRSVCNAVNPGGDTSAWSARSATFTTLCLPVTAFPWTENFDALTTVGTTNFPPCWFKENGDWSTSAASTYNTSFSGANHLRDAWSTAATGEYMWTPGFNLTANTSYDFSFQVAGDGWTSWVLDVFHNTAQNSTGATQIGTSYSPTGPNSTTIQPYVKQTYTFMPSTSGVYYFAVRVTETTGSPWYMAFDDFRMEVTPTCPAPNSLNTANVTANTADLQWVEPGIATLWQIEYAPATTAFGSGTRVFTTSNPHNISGLLQNTAYKFYVRSVCAPGDTSTWSGPRNFTTTVSCPSPTAMTFANITGTSVDVSWTATSGTELLEYGPTGYTPGTGATAGVGGTLVSNVTSPYTITGLSPSSGYDIFIRQDCSAASNGFSSNLSRNLATTGAPANDTLCGAYNVTVGSTTPVWVNTTNATTSASDPSGITSCTGLNNNVWYKFTTGAAGVYNITAHASSVNWASLYGNMSAWAWLYSATGTCPSLTLTQVADLTLCTVGFPGPYNTTIGVPAGTTNMVSTPSLSAATTYYMILDGNSGAYGNIGITVSSPLAIKLDKISATNAGTANRVDWNTLSEESSDKFELQRSIDGKNFATIYEKRANGEASRYTYMDHNAVKGTNYYRLRMTAANGSVNYSEVVSAFVKSSGFEVDAYPNPVSHDLTVKVSGVQGADASVQVTDVTGKLIRTVKMNSSVETIDMSGLANGIYLIKYSDATHTQTIKVNKQ